MSDSKLTCYLTIEKNLSFCLTLVSLRKVKALGGKNRNKTTPSLTEVLQLKLSSLVRWMIIFPRDCVPPNLWSDSERLSDKRNDVSLVLGDRCDRVNRLPQQLS